MAQRGKVDLKKAAPKKAAKKVAKKVAAKVEKEIPSKPTNGINANMFDLTPEQMETSKMMYGGKIVKCLVAPYHVYATLEKIIPFTPTTYLFPEREMSTPQLKSLISMIVANKTATEFRIVTTNQNVIMDMVDDCVRVLTEYDEVVASPVKTFAANIHDIRYSLLENKDHQKSDEDKTESNKRISDLIDKVNDKKPITRAQYDSLYKEIDMIGEPIISNKLKEMLRDKDVLAVDLEETDPSKIKFDKREIEWIKSKEWYKTNYTVAKSLKDSIQAGEDNADIHKQLRPLHQRLLKDHHKPGTADYIKTTNDLADIDFEEIVRAKVNLWLSDQTQTMPVQKAFQKVF